MTLLLLGPSARVVPIAVPARVQPRLEAVKANVLLLDANARLHLVQAASGGGLVVNGVVACLTLFLVVVPHALVVAVAVFDPLLVAPNAGLLVLHARAISVRVVEARLRLHRGGVVARAGRSALDGRLVVGRLRPFHVTLLLLGPSARVVPIAVPARVQPRLEAVKTNVLLLDPNALLHFIQATSGGWRVLQDRAARLTLVLFAVPFARLVPIVVFDPLLEAPKAGLFVHDTRAVRVHVVVATLGWRVLELVARLALLFVTIPYARLVPVFVLDPFLVAREALVLVLNTMAVRLSSTNGQVVEATLGRLVVE